MVMRADLLAALNNRVGQLGRDENLPVVKKANSLAQLKADLKGATDDQIPSIIWGRAYLIPGAGNGLG